MIGNKISYTYNKANSIKSFDSVLTFGTSWVFIAERPLSIVLTGSGTVAFQSVAWVACDLDLVAS